MSNRYPLQDGDRSFDPSQVRGGTFADRREDDQNTYLDEQPGSNAAPSGVSPEGSLWKVGQLAPAKHTAPFSPIYTEGDTSGDGTKVHEVEIDAYGDDYDATAPMRVREVGNAWSFDSDHDGEKN